MTLPALLAAALLLVAPSALVADAPAECEVTGSSASCRWTVRMPTSVTLEIPTFGSTIAVLEIHSSDPVTSRPFESYFGWGAYVEYEADNETEQLLFNGNTGRKQFPEVAGAARLHLVLPPATQSAVLVVSGHAPADLAILYQASAVPEGQTPERPAATLDEPHLVGISGTEPGPLDLRAAWLTDDAMGDGLFEARLALGEISGTTETQDNVWGLGWSIADTEYRVTWGANDTGAPSGQCNFWLVGSDERTVTQLAYPDCGVDEESAVLWARIPEAAVGYPAAGALFLDMRAWSLSFRTDAERSTGVVYGELGLGRSVDRLDQQRFPFALGGPAVWDALNGCRFCEAEAAWLDAPFSEAHLANTLQVAGAVTATGAFLVGLLLVRHRRKRVHTLLREVEAIVDAHRADAARGLLALGDLEDSFDARLRRGAITDAEYQIVSQRIATAATRLGMRRSLGLDDGAPDATEVRR